MGRTAVAGPTTRKASRAGFPAKASKPTPAKLGICPGTPDRWDEVRVLITKSAASRELTIGVRPCEESMISRAWCSHLYGIPHACFIQATRHEPHSVGLKLANPDDYLASIEFGNEVMGGSGTTWVKRFDIDVGGTH